MRSLLGLSSTEDYYPRVAVDGDRENFQSREFRFNTVAKYQFETFCQFCTLWKRSNRTGSWRFRFGFFNAQNDNAAIGVGKSNHLVQE